MTADDTWTVWVAYYPGWTGIAVFATEIEALRYAVEHEMKVARFASGEVLR